MRAPQETGVELLAMAGDEEDHYDGHIHAVGLKKPNTWGLYDINDLLWEYCRKSNVAPDTAESDAAYVCRGGCLGSRPPMFTLGGA